MIERIRASSRERDLSRIS